jgi:hypothetical protein
MPIVKVKRNVKVQVVPSVEAAIKNAQDTMKKLGYVSLSDAAYLVYGDRSTFPTQIKHIKKIRNYLIRQSKKNKVKHFTAAPNKINNLYKVTHNGENMEVCWQITADTIKEMREQFK